MPRLSARVLSVTSSRLGASPACGRTRTLWMLTPTSPCVQEDPRIDHTVLKCTKDDHVITIASAGDMTVAFESCWCFQRG